MKSSNPMSEAESISLKLNDESMVCDVGGDKSMQAINMIHCVIFSENPLSSDAIAIGKCNIFEQWQL